MVNPYEASREAYEPIIVAEIVPDGDEFDLIKEAAEWGHTALYVLMAFSLAVLIGAIATALAT